jgi:hypothetical protein
LAGFAVAGGCSSGSFESTVAGKVTLDGKPIGPGTVVFALAEGQTNPAVGTIQPGGDYLLKTSRTEGLQPGKYRVAVTVFEPLNLPPGERSTVPSKLIHPEKYTTVDTSGMEFEVAAGSNAIDIALTSK